jgi:cyanophycin synthetase
VVKPLDANHGRGVSIGLETEEQVAVAYAQAPEHSRCVLVETYIKGFDHRMFVVNGELVAVAKRMPGHVVGDGVHTVAQLVEIVNQDPRRGIGHEKVLTRLELDHQAERLLEQAGHRRRDGPARGRGLLLAQHGQPVHGRHGDRPHRHLPPRQQRDGVPRHAASASTCAASTSCRRTSPAPTKRSAAASAR